MRWWNSKAGAGWSSVSAAGSCSASAAGRGQEQRQSGALQIGIALQEVAQALGHREDSPSRRQVRHDVIGEVRCRRHHAPSVAQWADSASLAREGDQEIMAAGVAPGLGKTPGDDSTIELAAEFPLHVLRRRPLGVVALAAVGEPGL
jgi:hypothetical protein